MPEIQKIKMPNGAVDIDEVIEWISDQADRYQSSVCCDDPVIAKHVAWLRGSVRAIETLKVKSELPQDGQNERPPARKRKHREQMR